MTVTRINQFKAAPQQEDALYDFLHSLIPYITASEGNQGCEVLRHHEAKDSFVVVEKWDSVDAHQASIKGFPEDKMMAAMPLFGAPPQGDYYT